MSQLTLEFTDEEKKRAKSHSESILHLLEDGPVSSSRLLDVTHRFSACIKVLWDRGYVIDVQKLDDGTSIHTLIDHVPTVEVTDQWKASYYESEHWRERRRSRMLFDEFRCCHCRSTNGLQVHHWRYDLFAELIEDLSTLCGSCHERIHNYSAVKLHFPTHVPREVFKKLATGCKPVAAGAAQ